MNCHDVAVDGSGGVVFVNKRAEHDVDRAEKIAEKREDDAAFAVEFAYAAIEEAEYAILDAALARTEADEASAA